MADVAYTIINEPSTSSKSTLEQYRSLLEKSKDEVKIDAMKKILISMLNGNLLPSLLMHVIRYVMPSKNKELKKLLYFYWEICPKLDDEGKLRQEMILVCNAIRNDLQHPNEYIRGMTLKFLTKLKEPDLLEPLVPSCRTCLEHRHSYVRKNAVFAIWSIFKVSDYLLPDASELVANFLEVETDSICKRNAFVCLGDLDRERALLFIQNHDLNNLDSILQISIIEFIRKDFLKYSELNENYLFLITDLLESSDNSTVIYECATTLTILSSSTSAIIAAASKFIDLSIKVPDNNVKLICLERINGLNDSNPGVLQDLCLDIIRILNSQDYDVRKNALKLILRLINKKNVEDVIKFLKKELATTITSISNTNSSSSDDLSIKYRELLISTINTCAIKFYEIAADVIDLLLDIISDLNTVSASEIISFVKEVVEKYPKLRSSIIHKLIDSLHNVRSGKVYRNALWIIGEYCLEEKDIQDAWRHIRSNVGKLPILASEQQSTETSSEDGHENENGNDHDHENTKKKGPLVLPDGTYATESALTTEIKKDDLSTSLKPPIRQFILDGDFYLGAVLSTTIVKLVLRFQRLSKNKKVYNVLKAEAMLIMVSILRVGESKYVKTKIDEDSAERIFACVRFLADDSNNDEKSIEFQLLEGAFLEDTKNSFKKQLAEDDNKKLQDDLLDFAKKVQQVDDTINFRQFKSKHIVKSGELEEIESIGALKISGSGKKEKLSSRLNKIIQLTGFSDPVYAEALVTVNQFDVVLDVLVVNQTTETLRNLSVEFATLGDLQVIDKATSSNVGPHGFHKVRTSIKVTSADTGVIFGNIVYDGQHSDDSRIVILNDVHVNIMDYIKPASCSEAQFRTMWNEFEWENKISIKSNLPSLKTYLDLLLSNTNMKCLTPGAIVGEECQFLSANLYSKSSFGEDALANLCIEKTQTGPIMGHIRIRSKGQGLALSLGDRIASISRKSNKYVIAAV
ncbi:coatomer subunit beta [Ascoidea rubescens DSM 1968]|uniref:Coatomer subunit beta n=1 Tax=Ascoidea rubescens DSM 1968 TaxID=1344418 RepID=A0A1D2VMF9_9ASCO|nr:Coatomer, beta subunit [Ascoidea rubescens DSM 1968]ODV62747.1 Coatomer, beta subunit [Ascoidea rubescens DSM 1968]